MTIVSDGPYTDEIEVRSTANVGLAINASGYKVGFSFAAPKTGNISKVHFRLGTVATGHTLKLSLQDKDATGFADGTIDQSGTVAVLDTDDDSWKAVTLSASRAVAEGDRLWAVIEFDSTVGDLQIDVGNVNSYESSNYCALYTTAWSSQNRTPIVVIEYDDVTYGHISNVSPGIFTGVSFNSASTPDEIGNIIRYSAPKQITGARIYMIVSAAFTVTLYDTDGTTVLTSVTLGANEVRDSSTYYIYDVKFPAKVTLAANSNYRLTIKPTTTTNVTIVYLEVSDANHWGQLPGGSSIYMTERTDSGSWTDTTTRKAIVSLWASGIDDAAGGGGLLRHPGMNGNING